MSNKFLRNVFITVLAIYAVFSVAFYFIAGDRLRFKDSPGNIAIVDADGITPEINESVTITQDFDNRIESIKEIAVVFTKYYRDIDGEVTIELLDGTKVLYGQVFDNTGISEQHRVYLKPDHPLEGYKGKTLTLKISSTCTAGNGVSVMMTSGQDSSIKVNEKDIPGRICFSAIGSDLIVASNYYWFIIGGFGLLIAVVLLISYVQYTKGRVNIIVSGVKAAYNYEFLIAQLVIRDFKSKYKRSVLGVFWSFLNPLLTMTVQFFVFSTLFAAGSKNYPVYLLSGVICYNFFKEATDMCLTSISGNDTLINKVYIPKYIFPLARTISSGINLAIALVPLALVSLILGVKFTSATILIFYFLGCLILFSLGIGMFLGALMVFFRDIQFLWNVITQIWLYATPIFYTAEIIPDKYKFIIRFNPLYHFIGNLRKCLLDGVTPEPSAFIYCLLFAVASFVIGSIVFKKTQDKFTLYL